MMKKWWNENWVDRRCWILEHLDTLTLSCEEVLVILLIDYMNEHHLAVRHDSLAQKLSLDSDRIDDILSNLSVKGYLTIDYHKGQIQFDIDGVFEDDTKRGTTFDVSLFELFESEFARPLSQMEVTRLSEWVSLYPQKLITYALREALVGDHKSFDYIDRILLEWTRRGLSPEDIEDGKR